MAIKDKDLEKKIHSLRPSARDEVLHYIDYLLAQQKTKLQTHHKFSFDWEGGLFELRDDFRSVELQHKANKWR